MTCWVDVCDMFVVRGCHMLGDGLRHVGVEGREKLEEELEMLVWIGCDMLGERV